MSALARSGLEPHRLELEITEGVFLGEEKHTDAIFDTLKRIGVRLALDDFGTGYSSLGYLRTAPFDKIKIDKSFVEAATLPGSRNAAIIAAIVALADALDMETTAEGIESHDQLAMIRDLGVSHVQGFIYSNALPNAKVDKHLKTGSWDIVPNGPKKQRSNRTSIYRRVTAIFGNHCRPVLIRNLSESGALVEGLDNVPIGSKLIIDFGEGQLTFASLVRSDGRQYGVQFESLLVSDENGRLRPPNKVSRIALQSAGLPDLVGGALGSDSSVDGEARDHRGAGNCVAAAEKVETGRRTKAGSGGDRSGAYDLNGKTSIGGDTPSGNRTARGGVTEGSGNAEKDASGGTIGYAPLPADDNSEILEHFRAKLGIATPKLGEQPAAAWPKAGGLGLGRRSGTLEHLAVHYLAAIGDDHARYKAEENLLKNYILPYFGHLQAGEISADYVVDWAKLINNSEALNLAEFKAAQDLLIQLKAENLHNGLAMVLSRKAAHERHLSEDEVCRLKQAALESPNQQLSHLISLLMVTGVRQRDLVEARWSDFDLDSGVWEMPCVSGKDSRALELSAQALELVRQIPRREGCDYLLANPKTGKPYKSFASSWQTILQKANLQNLEIDDVRNCFEHENMTAFVAKSPCGHD
jgi:hypothetical protein